MTDFVETYDKMYGPLLEVRSHTFRAVLREAQHRLVNSIVETGCVRAEDNWKGDGQSSVIWNHFITVNGGSFTTIDNDDDAITTTQKICPYARCLIGDSIEVLTKDKNTIDLLYLDSFDLDMDDMHPAAIHCLFEFLSARPRLHPGSIVFIDDSPITADSKIIGKGMYVAQYLEKLSIRPFTTGYQAAWVLP